MYLYDVIIYLDIIYEYAHDYVKKKKNRASISYK